MEVEDEEVVKVSQSVTIFKNPLSIAVDIDDELHSRQLAVYGRQATRKLIASNVLVSGLQGLGAEIAKNLILAGVKSVTLHDERLVELWDMSSNFLFSDKDIGKNRAVASYEKLQELNRAVTVNTLTTGLTKEDLSQFQAVVFTDIRFEKAIEFDDYCHRQQPPIAFIKAEVCGLFGSVFCDFGPQFTLADVNGPEPHTCIAASISNDNPALIVFADDKRVEFKDGDLVIFSDVCGMTELNDGRARRIKSARPYSFNLDEDTTYYGTYEGGGMVTKVKQSKVLNFKPLKEALKDPGDFLLSDFSKFDRAPLLHLAFQALDSFKAELGRFPVSGSEDDAQKLISIASRINHTSSYRRIEEIDQTILRHFVYGAKAVLSPMAAMFGGIVAEEIVKSCSRRFHPLFQFFYFDSVESLPTKPLSPGDLKPLNSRYDAQVSVFGSKLQRKLQDSKVFMVGAGALGCEFLKNLALMGVSCGNNGKLTVTDNDVIGKNNLSRQFLFHDYNIGQPKPTVAAVAATAINPSFRIEALQSCASPETENVFDYSFWQDIDVVINALDNVNARLYIGQRCVYFQKPLLESGTLGTKCDTQMVVPHLTENYGASRSFPHNINHCLTWARSEFEGTLEKTPTEVNAYLTNPDQFASSMLNAGDAQAKETLGRVLDCLEWGGRHYKTFKYCLIWARIRFEYYFVDRVKQLTFTFPEDAVTSNGEPFWSAPKIFPRPLQFSVADPSHLQFVKAAAILRAETFRIPRPDWINSPERFVRAVNRVHVPKFVPKRDLKMVTDENETSLPAASKYDSRIIERFFTELRKARRKWTRNFTMKPIQFEKDDDTNYHMDMIAGLANLRARNYGIQEVDKLKAKFINGGIIQGIATATSLATGLVCLELYKLVDGGHKVEDYRNTSVDLALPFFSMTEPVPPKVTNHQEMSWTVWDRWVLGGDPTLRELLVWLHEKGLRAYRISYGSCLLYNSMVSGREEILDKKMVDLVRDVAEADLPADSKHFDVVVACEDEDLKNVNIPQVSVYFR